MQDGIGIQVAIERLTEELSRYGPEGAAPVPAEADARAYTRQLAARHYENFPVLSLFVPWRLRQHFANVYAYCRWADDLADEIEDPQKALVLLDWWETELDGCYSGRPRHPVMVALAETIGAFGIPRQPFVDLLAAFRRDQRQTRYATYADLLDYCRCSADPVGRLVLYLCKAHNAENAALSDAVCTGLQLANFWQDVCVDLEKGRIYLPLEDMARFGVTEESLAAPDDGPAFRKLLAFEVERAEELLRRGLPLARRLRGRLRVAVAGFALGGLAILQKIRAAHFTVLQARPKLTRGDKLAVLARALFGRW